MSFSHYDEDGARTSHHTHCCMGARRATQCTTGDDLWIHFLKIYFDLWIHFFFFFFLKILIASMSHSYKPTRLGTWHRRHSFDKHIYKSNQLYLLHNEAGSNTQHIVSLKTNKTKKTKPKQEFIYCKRKWRKDSLWRIYAVCYCQQQHPWDENAMPWWSHGEDMLCLAASLIVKKI